MKTRGYLFVLLFTLANALEYLMVKSSELGVYLTGIIIFGSGGILLFLTYLISSSTRTLHFSFPIGSALFIGLISFIINIAWIKGLQYTTAANTAVLGKTDVVFSLLLSFVLLKEKISKLSLLCIGITLIGIILIMDVKIGDVSGVNKGDILIIISAALLAFNAFRVKRVLQGTDFLLLASINCLINVAGFSAIYLYSSRRYIFSSGTMGYALTGGVCLFLFFCGYYPALKTFALWKVRSLALLTPLFTVIGGILFLKERLSALQFFGIVLPLVGVAGIIFIGKKNNEGLAS